MTWQKLTKLDYLAIEIDRLGARIKVLEKYLITAPNSEWSRELNMLTAEQDFLIKQYDLEAGEFDEPAERSR